MYHKCCSVYPEIMCVFPWDVNIANIFGLQGEKDFSSEVEIKVIYVGTSPDPNPVYEA